MRKEGKYTICLSYNIVNLAGKWFYELIKISLWFLPLCYSFTYLIPPSWPNIINTEFDVITFSTSYSASQIDTLAARQCSIFSYIFRFILIFKRPNDKITASNNELFWIPLHNWSRRQCYHLIFLSPSITYIYKGIMSPNLVPE